MKLVRAVPCPSPLRLGRRPRGDAMTMMIVKGAVYVGLISLGVGLASPFVGPRIQKMFGESPRDLATAAGTQPDTSDDVWSDR